MIMSSNVVAIIADDLTGANDSALQFYLQGANTQILLSDSAELENCSATQVWSVSTETRNVSQEVAFEKVKETTRMLMDKVNPDYFFKKIDSTIRGNIAIETLTVLNEIQWDAAVVVPAFPDEQRITVGGYHLLRSMPIERTEVSHDPKAPICESHLPTLLECQLIEEYRHLVGHVELKTIMKGAGPILVKINELLAEGKKLIVMDAVSNTDIEQISLAIRKIDKQILPTGTAAFAKALAKLWFGTTDDTEVIQQKIIPPLPKCIISGSATQLCAAQIAELKASYYFDNFAEYNIKFEDICSCVSDELVSDIVSNLAQGKNVLIHTTGLEEAPHDAQGEEENEENISFPSLITDYLSELAYRIKSRIETIFIFIGGETAYKSCERIGATRLQLIDKVTGPIPLCLDYNGQWVVTKSGNLGDAQTMVEVLKYFEK